MSNRIIRVSLPGVLNSFVQPAHSRVPLLLLTRVMPYYECFSGVALLCHCLESIPVIQHHFNLGGRSTVTECYGYQLPTLLLVLGCPFGIVLHQSRILSA